MSNFILVDPNDPDNPPRGFDTVEKAVDAKKSADAYYKKLAPTLFAECSLPKTIIYRRVSYD